MIIVVYELGQYMPMFYFLGVGWWGLGLKMSLPLRDRAIIRGINPSERALARLIPLETKHTHLLTYNYLL